jgi:formamidopyrimidine-DNA glycosylase
VPELPEVEITARLIGAATKGVRIESVLAPGLNAVKTFDPPLHALDGATLDGIRRRGKLFLIDAHADASGPAGPEADYTLVVHLMSAGRLQLYDKRASLKDKTSRVLLRLADGERELRLREFGTKQRAWVKLLRRADVDGEEMIAALGPEAWPQPPEAAELQAALKQPRPLYALLRDQHVIAGIGRSWVDEILHDAKLSPFKRGSDLGATETAAPTRGDHLPPRWRARSLRAGAHPAYSGQASTPAPHPPPRGRTLLALRSQTRGRLLRGLRDVLLPRVSDRRQGAQGPPAFAATQVAGGFLRAAPGVVAALLLEP